jgi:UDP-glucose 4-epimerase
MAFQTINVLVTGSTGFIGHHLRNRLLKDERIRLVCVGSSLSANQTDHEISVQASLGSLTSTSWKNFGIKQFDVVFHLAAFTPKDSGNANAFEPIVENNIQGSVALLKSFECEPKRFVFASTLDVYAPCTQAITEDSLVAPTGLYGLSKVFCERMIHVDAKNRGYDYCVLRFGHIFGPGEDAYRKLIPTFIRNAIRGEPLIIGCDGTTKRDFLYVDDAVRATISAGFSHSNWDGPTNIVRGSSVTLKEVAETIKRASHSDGDIVLKNDQKGHSMQFRNDRMVSRLGQFDFTTFESGIEQEVAWFKNKVSK